MTEHSSQGFSRRALLGAFAATTITAAPTFSNAAGFLRGSGDIRRLKMYSARTGEKIDMIYWIEGSYIKDAVKELTWFMRDWRTNDSKNIDMRTIDIMAASHNLLDVKEPYMLLSGYRSPKTNRDASGAFKGRGEKLAAPERPSRGPAAGIAVRGPDGPGRGILPGRWRRSVFGFKLRAYGLWSRAQLGAVSARPFSVFTETPVALPGRFPLLGQVCCSHRSDARRRPRLQVLA